jgi:hypothetical protein
MFVKREVHPWCTTRNELKLDLHDEESHPPLPQTYPPALGPQRSPGAYSHSIVAGGLLLTS